MKQILLMIAVVELVGLVGCVSTHTGATAKKDEAAACGQLMIPQKQFELHFFVDNSEEFCFYA